MARRRAHWANPQRLHFQGSRVWLAGDDRSREPKQSRASSSGWSRNKGASSGKEEAGSPPPHPTPRVGSKSGRRDRLHFTSMRTPHGIVTRRSSGMISFMVISLQKKNSPGRKGRLQTPEHCEYCPGDPNVALLPQADGHLGANRHASISS